MKRLTDILDIIIGVIACVVAIWQLILFVTFKDAAGRSDMMAGINHLWLAIIAAIVAVACVVVYFMRHPRVQEEIHVTK